MLLPENLPLVLATISKLEAQMLQLLAEVQLMPVAPPKSTMGALEQFHASARAMTLGKSQLLEAFMMPDPHSHFGAHEVFTAPDGVMQDVTPAELEGVDVPHELRPNKGRKKQF